MNIYVHNQSRHRRHRTHAIKIYDSLQVIKKKRKVIKFSRQCLTIQSDLTNNNYFPYLIEEKLKFQ